VKIQINKLLEDIEGKPIMSGDDKGQFQACLGHICVVALTTDSRQDENEPGGKKFHRWQIAKAIKKALENEQPSVELPVEDIELIKKRIGTIFQTKIMGPAYEAIESSH
jgi:hypothetical protein